MPNTYRIKTIKSKTGERSVYLLKSTGIPDYDATIYTISELKAKRLSTNTIEQILRAIQVLYLHLEVEGISLNDRLAKGELFNQPEIDKLVQSCHLPLTYLEEQLDQKQSNVTPLRLSPKVIKINTKSVGVRMYYITAFLQWLVLERAAEYKDNKELVELLKWHYTNIAEILGARVPSAFYGTGNAELRVKNGLSVEAQDVLKRAIVLDSPSNPWKNLSVRVRNALIVNILLNLGLRRGELLGLKLADINVPKNQITVMKRNDDVEDPRVVQPRTKTLARVLPLSGSLAKQIMEYITKHRAKLPGARKHGFLFVSHQTGQPLTSSALNKLFEELKNSNHFLKDISPHILRHTWNDNFSEYIDNAKISEQDEVKARSTLMGWSEHSGMAANYTKRHVKEKSFDISLKMQEKITGKVSE